LLVPGGRVLIEHGELQGAQVRSLLTGFEDVRTHPDLTGRDRITGGRLRSS
jgi:release factor glutamine methyltransferase